MEAADTEDSAERPGSVAAMSSGSVDEELEDESMGDNIEDEDDIAEAEDLSIKSQTPTKSESSNPSPASNSLIGELMSKFGFNDIQEYQVMMMNSIDTVNTIAITCCTGGVQEGAAGEWRHAAQGER